MLNYITWALARVGSQLRGLRLLGSNSSNNVLAKPVSVSPPPSLDHRIRLTAQSLFCKERPKVFQARIKNFNGSLRAKEAFAKGIIEGTEKHPSLLQAAKQFAYASEALQAAGMSPFFSDEFVQKQADVLLAHNRIESYVHMHKIWPAVSFENSEYTFLKSVDSYGIQFGLRLCSLLGKIKPEMGLYIFGYLANRTQSFRFNTEDCLKLYRHPYCKYRPDFRRAALKGLWQNIKKHIHFDIESLKDLAPADVAFLQSRKALRNRAFSKYVDLYETLDPAARDKDLQAYLNSQTKSDHLLAFIKAAKDRPILLAFLPPLKVATALKDLICGEGKEDLLKANVYRGQTQQILNKVVSEVRCVLATISTCPALLNSMAEYRSILQEAGLRLAELSPDLIPGINTAFSQIPALKILKVEITASDCKNIYDTLAQKTEWEKALTVWIQWDQMAGQSDEEVLKRCCGSLHDLTRSLRFNPKLCETLVNYAGERDRELKQYRYQYWLEEGLRSGTPPSRSATLNAFIP